MSAIFDFLNQFTTESNQTSTNNDNAKITFLSEYLPQFNTHRVLMSSSSDDDAQLLTAKSTIFFPYECALAALSIAFCRMTVTSYSDEPFRLRLFFAILLAFMCLMHKQRYIICAFEIFSYALPLLLLWYQRDKYRRVGKGSNEKHILPLPPFAACLIGIITSGIASYTMSKLISQRGFIWFLRTLFPHPALRRAAFYLFPVEEMYSAYTMILRFTNAEELHPNYHNCCLSPFIYKWEWGIWG